MKKHTKFLSLTALALVIVLCFSGCGVLNFAKSLLIKDDTPQTTAGTSEVIPHSEETVGNNTVIVVPSSEATEAQVTEAAATLPSETKAPSTTKAEPQTQAPVISTTEEISQTSLKELQDRLFATKDPTEAAKILKIAGFEYDQKQGIYYSQINPLQRLFGFNFIYDMAAPFVGMFYATKKIEFVYEGKEWMVQIWKGQYGITCGAEIGLYNRPADRLIQYDCADDKELIEMQFDFYNDGNFVFTRGPENHWWLTGFKVLSPGIPILIDLDITLKFKDNKMGSAFERALKKTISYTAIDPITYTRRGSTFNIKW